MDNDFKRGIKHGLGIMFIFSLFYSVFAVGFHLADEVLPGTFIGNFNFNDKVNFENEVVFNSTVNFGNATLVEESWQTPTLLNSWINYGSGASTAQYYKSSNNVVYVKGLIRWGVVANGCIFYLPSGYRPLESHYFYASTSNYVGRIRVDSDGCIYPLGITDNTWVQLDGILFRAEQ